MHDDIDQVKQSTDKITKIVFDEKASQIKDMVLVTFNDPSMFLNFVKSLWLIIVILIPIQKQFY